MSAVHPEYCNLTVWAKDSKTRKSINQDFFVKRYIGEDFDVCPNINGNGTPELVVLKRRDDGALMATIKYAKIGEFVNWVGF